MNTSEILRLRLYNSGLSHSPFENAVDAVSHLGAAQAQDFPAAKLGLGLRYPSVDRTFRRRSVSSTVCSPGILRRLSSHLGFGESERTYYREANKALIIPVTKRILAEHRSSNEALLPYYSLF